MFTICISAGGGKSYLANKYPDEFIDIDSLVWDAEYKLYHTFLVDAIKNQNMSMIGNIYYKILSDLSEKMKQTNKIVLIGHPINSIWLKMKCIAILRPSKMVQLNYIKNRPKEDQLVAINNWNSLSEYTDLIITFNDITDNYNIIKNLVKNKETIIF